MTRSEKQHVEVHLRRRAANDGHVAARPTPLPGLSEVHAGRTFVPPAIAIKLAERLPTEALSPYELEVLRFLADGKPSKLIGAVLSITEVTVKSHVQSVFRKLNVLSHIEAIAVPSRRGLLRI